MTLAPASFVQPPATEQPLPVLPDGVREDPRLGQVLAHWNRARGAALVPAWSSLSMRGFGACLPYLVLHELCGDDMVIRLSGTGMRPFFGTDATGRSVRDFTPPELWPIRLARYRQAISTPCGFWAATRSTLLHEMGWPVGLVYLPVRDLGPQKHDGLLAVTTDLGPDRQMRKFEQLTAEIPAAGRIEVFSIGAGVPVSLA